MDNPQFVQFMRANDVNEEVISAVNSAEDLRLLKSSIGKSKELLLRLWKSFRIQWNNVNVIHQQESTRLIERIIESTKDFLDATIVHYMHTGLHHNDDKQQDVGVIMAVAIGLLAVLVTIISWYPAIVVGVFALIHRCRAIIVKWNWRKAFNDVEDISSLRQQFDGVVVRSLRTLQECELLSRGYRV
jgi:hypothetical protein